MQQLLPYVANQLTALIYEPVWWWASSSLNEEHIILYF